jgi:hypothetical protein
MGSLSGSDVDPASDPESEASDAESMVSWILPADGPGSRFMFLFLLRLSEFPLTLGGVLSSVSLDVCEAGVADPVCNAAALCLKLQLSP